MILNLYTTVSSCSSLKENFHKKEKREATPSFPGQLFQLSVLIDIISWIPKTEGGNNDTLLITDRQMRLAKYISTTGTMAKRPTNIFIEKWVTHLVIFSTLLTDDGHQLISILLAALCKGLGIKTVTTINYYLQSTTHVECFGATMISMFRR